MKRIGLGALTVIVAGVLTIVAIQLINEPAARGVGSGGSPAPMPSALTPAPTDTPSAVPATPPPATPEPTTTVHPTGILLVDVGEPVQGKAAPSEASAMAFSGLIDLAMAHPVDLSYPWQDPETHELVISVVTDAGRALAEEVGPGLGFPYRIRDATYSYAELEKIGYDISLLVPDGAPDADLIYQLVPDWRDGRMVVVISEMSEPLLAALAERFPPDAIAIQVDPRRGITGY